MFEEQRTRTLMGPADPVRAATVPPPRFTAHELIVRAEGTTGMNAARVDGPSPARPSRRWVLAAGALAIGAGATAAARSLVSPGTDGTGPGSGSRPGSRPGSGSGSAGSVLVPVAYEFGSGGKPAAAELRALADRLVDAPYDNRTGRYMFHDTRTWGDPVSSSEDGRYLMGYADETKTWRALDGTGRQSSVQLEPQFPDEASREYWRKAVESLDTNPGAEVYPLDAQGFTPLPTDLAGLRRRLMVVHGAGAVPKQVASVYAGFVVPRATRAEILRIIADVPGFVWRGKVVDRAGRKGVAITFDDRVHEQQSLLIFNPTTGDLFAEELVTLAHGQISAYQMIITTDWVDELR